MTQEEKQLLLKDLCARLPYGVKGLALGDRDDTISILVPGEYPWVKTTTDLVCHLGTGQFKPYLRPMLSMTEEEKEEIRQQFCYEWEESVTELMYYSIEIGDADCLIDWFLEHHFDFRGLISKGLALEASEGMYKQ